MNAHSSRRKYFLPSNRPSELFFSRQIFFSKILITIIGFKKIKVIIKIYAVDSVI